MGEAMRFFWALAIIAIAVVASTFFVGPRYGFTWGAISTLLSGFPAIAVAMWEPKSDK
jgi:hypothetical protein